MIPHIIRAVMESPWAIMPSKMMAIIEFLSIRSQGIKFSAEEVESKIGARAHGEDVSGGGSIRVIPMMGVISQRIELMDSISSGGGVSAENLVADINSASADNSVSKIILNISSPGGSVYGIAEAAQAVNDAKAIKPVIAVANSLAASAAFWIGSNASEFVVAPGGDVGSIGVISAHQDISKALDDKGVNTTLISAGKFKDEGSPFKPLSEEALANLQSRVDEYYHEFVDAVASGRGVSTAKVESDFGQGRIVGSKQALASGMVDSVETLNQVIARHQTKNTNSRRQSNHRRAQLLSAR